MAYYALLPGQCGIDIADIHKETTMQLTPYDTVFIVAAVVVILLIFSVGDFGFKLD